MRYVKHKQHIRRYAISGLNFISDQWVAAHRENSMIDGIDYTTLENSATLFTAHESVPVNFKYTINKVDNNLILILKNETENRQLIDLKIDLNLFANLAGQCTYTISSDIIRKNIEDNFNEWVTLNSQEATTPSLLKEPEEVTVSQIINAYSTTYQSKSKTMYSAENVFSFFVTKDNPTADDIVLVLIVPQEIGDTEELAYGDLNGNPFANIDTSGWASHNVVIESDLENSGFANKLHETLMDPIDIVSVDQSDTYLTVSVTAAEVDYIYLEQVSGFLAKTKIPVVNGSATFKVSTIGLDAGDEVITKIGYKYWSNHRTLTHTLV